ncbi:MAG: hypothetical protein CHACPFDD_02891 [Phycisphaerae bacterium]|nr:hypothetical protein [Phycisphaerae bacterium]
MLLDAYRPGTDGPWDRRTASHLLRRAGFAPAPADVDDALKEGLARTVDILVSNAQDAPRHGELDVLGERIAAGGGGIEKLAGWWMQRLLHTHRPLHARMTLFWHNHFATGNQKVGSPAMMLRQLRTLEAHALGRFDELLLAVSRDPAMIVWLDGDSNRKGKPNENYARELFELFSLGPGNYSEADIKEAARAFSGWHQRAGEFCFNPVLHDDGSKTIFGKTGDFDGTDVVRMSVAHPACATFMARKLLREFVCEQLDAALVDELADCLRAEGFHVAPVLRRLLSSRAFFDARHFRARIKSPVEFCVGLARSLEMRAPGQALHRAASQMGQRLFEPPTVKGWEGHRRWINSSTMLVRINTATVASAGRGEFGLDADAWVARAALENGAAATRFAIDAMLDGAVDDELHAALREAEAQPPAAALRTAVAVIAASPDYQLA